MIWVQPPGTATMGHLFLDAFNATGDAYYYDAAARAADALIAGQHRSGGWNYFIRLRRSGGDAALVRDGRPQRLAAGGIPALCGQCHVRRCRHGGGDAAAAAPLSGPARTALPAAAGAGDRFRAQQPISERRLAAALALRPAIIPPISGCITFNDDVAKENIRFLIMAGQALERPDLLRAARRGMEIFLTTQGRAGRRAGGCNMICGSTSRRRADLRAPRAGHAHDCGQYRAAAGLLPADRRPPLSRAHSGGAGLAGLGTTAGRRRPARAPLPRPSSNSAPTGRSTTTGAAPTSSTGFIIRTTTRPARSRIIRNSARSTWNGCGAIMTGSPPCRSRKPRAVRCCSSAAPIPRFFILDGLAAGSDFTSAARLDVREIVRALNEEGWWPSPLSMTSHPSRGPGSRRSTPGDYGITQVGDETDTSPFPDPNPRIGISTATYIANMARLIGALEGRR